MRMRTASALIGVAALGLSACTYSDHHGNPYEHRTHEPLPPHYERRLPEYPLYRYTPPPRYHGNPPAYDNHDHRDDRSFSREHHDHRDYRHAPDARYPAGHRSFKDRDRGEHAGKPHSRHNAQDRPQPRWEGYERRPQPHQYPAPRREAHRDQPEHLERDGR